MHATAYCKRVTLTGFFGSCYVNLQPNCTHFWRYEHKQVPSWVAAHRHVPSIEMLASKSRVFSLTCRWFQPLHLTPLPHIKQVHFQFIGAVQYCTVVSEHCRTTVNLLFAALCTIEYQIDCTLRTWYDIHVTLADASLSRCNPAFHSSTRKSPKPTGRMATLSRGQRLNHRLWIVTELLAAEILKRSHCIHHAKNSIVSQTNPFDGRQAMSRTCSCHKLRNQQNMRRVPCHTKP